MKSKLRDNIICRKIRAGRSKIKQTKSKISQWWTSHTQFKAYPYIKRCLFCFVALVTLLLPDLLLRNFVQPKVYSPGDITYFADILPFIFSGLWVVLFFLFTVMILPKRWGRILYIFIGALFFIFAFAQYVYYGIFEQFFRLSSLGLAGEGADYLSYALSKVDSILIKYTVCEIIGLILIGFLWEKPAFKKRTAKIFSKSLVALPIAGLVFLHFDMMPVPNDHKYWDAWKRPGVIYEDFTDANKCLDITGVYHFALRDVYKLCFSEDDFSKEDYATVDSFFEQKEAEYTENSYTGLFEGKNVISVMLEGVDDWMVSEEYTPVMKYMMENGINLSNHYAPLYGTGYTLGSEFCFNTGYYTPISGVSAVNYIDNHFPYTIPKLFAEKGYSVNSFHFNNAEFYNRGIMHKQIGFEKYHAFTEYGMSEYEAMSDSLVLENDDIFNAIVKDEPFYSFIVTYSPHIPYTGDDVKLVRARENHPELIDPQMDPEQNNCCILARDTDDFFRLLLERLHESGKLKDTVIVVYTDHYAYGFSDHERLKGFSSNPNPMLVPAFIYNYGTEPVEITKPTQTSDLAPTIVNLFGLENHHCYIGNDILNPENDGFVYFADYGWMEGDFVFNPGDRGDSEQMQAGQLRTKELIEINDIVIAGDYFKNRQ